MSNSPNTNANSQTSSSSDPTTTSPNGVSSSTSPSASLTTPTTSPGSSGSTSSNNRLSNGAVAGIVIGVALGLAFLTFLVTFVIMRRQNSRSKRRSRSSKDGRGFGLSSQRPQDSTAGPKKPLGPEPTSSLRTYESYLPQSADDKTVQQKGKSTLEQVELHIENFYRNASSSTIQPNHADLSAFDSPYLPSPLASLLPRSKNKVNVIKHVLAQVVTSSISPSANPSRSLLPAEYTLLPSTVTSAGSRVSLKAGFTQILSRWRVMTAYLRPDPTKDAVYLSQRDRQINDIAQSFAKAFAPWKSTGYKDEERTRSLSAILEDAANLGIFLFSQPSTMTFHWAASGEVKSGSLVVSPALLKITDETGRDLAETQILVQQQVLTA